MWCMPHGNSLRVQLGPCKTCFHIPNSWPPLYLLEETSTHNLPGNGITPGNNHHLRSTSKSVSTMKLEPIPSCIVSNLLIVIPMDQTCGDFAFGKLFAKKDNPMLASFVPTEGTDFILFKLISLLTCFPIPFGFQTIQRPVEDQNSFNLLHRISKTSGEFWMSHILLLNAEL